MCMCTSLHVWWSEDNLRELVCPSIFTWLLGLELRSLGLSVSLFPLFPPFSQFILILDEAPFVAQTGLNLFFHLPVSAF